MIQRVEAKLGRMRKPQSFIVYPRDVGDETLIVQSDKSIGRFDISGVGLLNTHGSYFHHLSTFTGAVEFTFPPEFVHACLDACPKTGDSINGVVIA